MARYSIRRRAKRSRKATTKLLVDAVRFGEHGYSEPGRQFRNEKEVRRLIANIGSDFDRLVERLRDPRRQVDFFENLFLNARWHVGGDANVGIVENATGEKTDLMKGPGEIIASAYRAAYEDAEDALTQTMKSPSSKNALDALVSGASSLEAYLHHRIDIWNKTHPENTLPQDCKSDKFDHKVSDLIPVMTGRRFVKSGKTWSDYKVLMKYRNDLAVHPKRDAYSLSYNILVDIVNRFRHGITGLLVDLHIHFREPAPIRIIREQYAPEAELVDLDAGEDD